MTFSIHFLTIFSRQGITPLRKRIAQEMRIVEPLVTCYLHTDEIRFLIGFGLASQLHLCHDQTFIIAIELIYLEGMTATFHKIATLIDDATLTKLQKMLRLVHRYLLFKLIAGHAAIY